MSIYLKQGDSQMSYDHCIMPEVRKNVWVVYDAQTGDRIGEVGAMTESEARQLVSHHVLIPFRLSHIEE